MNTSSEQNDELCRLWQTLERPGSGMEVKEIMTLVETRAEKFERTIFWRNAREYGAAIIGAVIFAWVAYNATTPLEQIGNAIVSVAGIWIIAFLWLMQRSQRQPLPESCGDAYKNLLLLKYDRQILLTRTAGVWYVLPVTAGLVIAALGYEHAPLLGFVMAGVMVAVGIAITVLNWKAASEVAAEKLELQRLLEGIE